MLEDIKNDIAEFHRKHGACRLENEAAENEFIADAETVLDRCELCAETFEERHELAKFCNFLGSWLMVFTYRLKEGRKYYQKALALHPIPLIFTGNTTPRLKRLWRTRSSAPPSLFRTR